MASKEDIKKVILAVAGNPESGIVAEYADKWADAIVALDVDSKSSPDKETRTIKPTELR